MPPPSDSSNGEDQGPLKRLSFVVLLALAIEVVLLVMLGKAAL